MTMNDPFWNLVASAYDEAVLRPGVEIQVERGDKVAYIQLSQNTDRVLIVIMQAEQQNTESEVSNA